MSVQFDLYEPCVFGMRPFEKLKIEQIPGIKRLLEERDAIDSDDKYLRRNDPEKP